MPKGEWKKQTRNSQAGKKKKKEANSGHNEYS